MTEHTVRNRFVTGALEVTERAEAMAIPLEHKEEPLVEAPASELIEPGRALAQPPAGSAGGFLPPVPDPVLLHAPARAR